MLVIYDKNLNEIGTLSFNRILDNKQYQQLKEDALTLKSKNKPNIKDNLNMNGTNA